MQRNNSNDTLLSIVTGDSGFSTHIPNSITPGTNIQQHNVSRIGNPLVTQNNLTTAARYSMRINIRDVLNTLTPLMNNIRSSGSGDTHRRGFRALTRRQNSSGGESSSSNPSESFVINFENTREGSTNPTAHGLTGPSAGGTGHDQYQTDHTSLDLENVHQETSHHFSGSARNLAANNNNINNGDNNLGTSLAQPNEGIPEVPNGGGASREVQTIDIFLQKYFPFLVFIFLKVLYDHRGGIFIFVGLLITFAHANSVVKREIAKQSRRSLLSLSILMVYLLTCIGFIYFVFQEQKLYKCLIFIPPYNQPLNIWDLLWMIGITDFVLKFITIEIKAGLACFPAQLFPYSSRGKWYLMLECCSQLYRGLVPIQPWLYYLMEAYQGPEKVIGVVFSVAYVASKGTELLSKVKVFLRAFWKLIKNVSLGVRPSKKELATAGSVCPICHDEYNTPELLHCKHVFCEACIATWFDREQTCPLCRAKISDDPSWRDGATTFFTQFF